MTGRKRLGTKTRALENFVEDMWDLRSAGYLRRADYANRLNLSLSCFDQKMYRARRAGLLPPPHYFNKEYLPFGKQSWKKD